MTVYHIPFSESLLDTLSTRLLQQYQNNLTELANCLILLPNKRLIQNLRNAFLQNAKNSALILPKMVSIADLDYLMTSMDILPILKDQPIFHDIFKQVISPNKRAFILSTIIQKKDADINLTQAIYMAKSLGQIIDDAYLENVDFLNIENIVTSQLAEHWQHILQFLNIATAFWPDYLKENQLIDLHYRKKLIYQLQTILWKKNPPLHPILAINITSTYPDVLSLLDTINKLPQGDLYFYGIDFQEDDETYNNLPFNHPQKLLASTLSTLQIPRNHIKQLNTNNNVDHIIHKLFYKSLCKTFDMTAMDTFASRLTLINTKNEEEEARTIALLLREKLEDTGKTAGLISNNQHLVQRVINELKKWNIISNDYLGTPLKDSLHAKFFILVATVLKDKFEPNTLIALLNHPFCALGQDRNTIIHKTKLLNLHVARQFFYGSGLKQYLVAIKNLKSSNLQVILNGLINSLTDHFQPFLQLKSYKFNFNNLLRTHILIAENLALSKNNSYSELWTHQEGKELSILLANLLEDSKNFAPVSLAEYLGILESMINDIDIHAVYNKHPRIHIYGQMQSNLIHHDLLIISNMNEGSMPTGVPLNPWGNKDIMKKLGFTDKDYLIGLKSNIFCQYLGNKEIIFTRSNKEEGRLTNPSRWLLKITTMLNFYYKADPINIPLMNRKGYIYSLQEMLNIPPQITPLKNILPSFAPPLTALPKQISATKIEELIKNPYLFFISQILKLRPLDPVSANIEHLEYGNKVHKVLENYFQDIQKYKLLPLVAQQDKIIEIAQKEFLYWHNNVRFSTFKWPLTQHSLKNLLAQQNENIKNIQQSFIEVEGKISLVTPNTTLTITGRSDRIDLTSTNIAHIYDYKTSKEAKVEPYQKQLLILALILQQHGFLSMPKINPENIATNYIFLPKKFDDNIVLKDNGIDNVSNYLPNFATELLELLNKYYGTNPCAFTFNTNDKENKISKEQLHFMRFSELNITLQNDDSGNNNELA